MKKGSAVLLLLFIMSFCLVIGVFIGRNLRSDYAELPLNTVSVTEPTETESTDYRLDINRATKSQLMELPGIGEMLAERIIDYRTDNGPYQNIDELMSVEGIGQKKFQAIEALVKVGG